MEDNRQIWMKEKKRVDKQIIEEDQKFQEQWRKKNLEIEQNEKRENEEIRAMNVKLAKYHKKQADDKEKEREKLFMQDLEDAKNIADTFNREDKEFMSYAEKCVKTWDVAGKNVTPMILELQKQKKIKITDITIK